MGLKKIIKNLEIFFDFKTKNKLQKVDDLKNLIEGLKKKKLKVTNKLEKAKKENKDSEEIDTLLNKLEAITKVLVKAENQLEELNQFL